MSKKVILMAIYDQLSDAIEASREAIGEVKVEPSDEGYEDACRSLSARTLVNAYDIVLRRDPTAMVCMQLEGCYKVLKRIRRYMDYT